MGGNMGGNMGGRGGGMGRGMRGRGCWNWGPGAAYQGNPGYPNYQAAPVVPQSNAQQEHEYLQQQADMLQNELQNIKQRLAELETPTSDT